MKTSHLHGLELVYEGGRPYGIRDERGYLIFFREVLRFAGQDSRYQKELQEMHNLAGYMLTTLRRYKYRIE